eukprot:g337.t1
MVGTQLLALALAATCGFLSSAAFQAPVDDPDPAFSLLWDQDLGETLPTDPAQQLVVTNGSLPTWLSGRLVRIGPGQWQSKHRNMTWIYDGLAKVYSWTLAGGKASFRSAFLRSETFNLTRKNDKFPKMMTVGDVVPAFGIRDGVVPVADNINVNVWQLHGADTAFALTDAAPFVEFDTKTLATTAVHKMGPEGDGLKASVISCAHPHIEPGTGGASLINYGVQVGILGNATIRVWRMGADKKRKPFGAWHGVDFTPYMHSFAVTKDYVVLVVYPTSYSMMCMAAGKPMHTCMDWRGKTTPTRVVVFDLHSTDAAKPPLAVVDTEAFHSQHHINAYQRKKTTATSVRTSTTTTAAAGSDRPEDKDPEDNEKDDDDDGDDEIVIDMSAYLDPYFWTSKYPIGKITVMQNRTARNLIGGMGTLRRVVVSLSGSSSGSAITATATAEQIPVRDAQGNNYTFDFPFINRGAGEGGFDGKPYCYFYAFTPYAPPNPTEEASWATIKVNVCAKPGEPNAMVHSLSQQYPSEPVFVPRPGATLEDDGVLLLNVLDGAGGNSGGGVAGENNNNNNNNNNDDDDDDDSSPPTSFVSVLDAHTLEPVARVDHPTPHVAPYMQHASFFPIEDIEE